MHADYERRHYVKFNPDFEMFIRDIKVPNTILFAATQLLATLSSSVMADRAALCTSPALVTQIVTLLPLCLQYAVDAHQLPQRVLLHVFPDGLNNVTLSPVVHPSCDK